MFLVSICSFLSCLKWLIHRLKRQMMYLVNSKNPFLVFSSITKLEPPIPLSTPLTFLAVFIHLNLCFLLYPERATLIDIPPLPYLALLGLSALGPLLSVFSGYSWLSFAWWSSTGVLVCFACMVQRWIESEDKSISELERMKYIAPGA